MFPVVYGVNGANQPTTATNNNGNQDEIAKIRAVASACTGHVPSIYGIVTVRHDCNINRKKSLVYCLCCLKAESKIHDKVMATCFSMTAAQAYLAGFEMPYLTQIAKFMGPTWGPPGSCRPQMGPILAPWTLLSGEIPDIVACHGAPASMYEEMMWYVLYAFCHCHTRMFMGFLLRYVIYTSRLMSMGYFGTFR